MNAEVDFFKRTFLPALQIQQGYWYIATPYSKFPGGLDAAFEEACRFMANLIRHKVPCYSPIAHTHPIAKHGGLDPYDHGIWLPADKPMMDAAHGLIVCTMPTWEISYGISEEIKTFLAADKLVHYLDPGSVA